MWQIFMSRKYREQNPSCMTKKLTIDTTHFKMCSDIIILSLKAFWCIIKKTVNLLQEIFFTLKAVLNVHQELHPLQFTRVC